MRRLAKLSIVIAAAALTAAGQFAITTKSPLPTATIGQPYVAVTLQTAGDQGPITWSFSAAPAGGPPAGFSVGNAQPPDTTGTFCYGSPCTSIGVQAAPGVYTFTIQATSQTTGQTAFQQFTMSVVQPQSLQITTMPLLPNAVAGQQYATQLQAIGGTGQYVWSLVESALPPGIALDPATGKLAGIAPSVNASYTFTIQVQDQGTQSTANQTFTLNVAPVLSITTTSLPNATVNQPYSYQLLGSGGSNLIWTLQPSSQSPTLFTLSQGGLLSGFPLATGKFAFIVQLTDAQTPGAATKTFPFYITLGPLSIQEVTLPGANQNVAYNTTLTPVGGLPPYTWSITGTNTSGVGIDPNTGTISGTPPNTGAFNLAVSVTDSAGAVFSQTYSLSVAAAVSITTSTLPNGTPGTGYSAKLTATGGSLPFSWSVSAGTLPPGLTLNPDSGVISGSPTTQGAFQFTIKVTDFFKGTATKAFTVVIGAIQQLVIITTSLPDGGLTQNYTQILAATGGVLPYTWSVSGNLPAGLQLNASTGVIGGTPTAVGNVIFVVVVTDAQQNIARQSLSINVTDPANPVVITSSDFSGTFLVAFSQTLTATGGTPPYTWSIAAGSLPAGLNLNIATGVISGTPSAPSGITRALITATDARNQVGSKEISITISQPPPPPTTITVGSTTQPTLGLTLGAPYPVDITGTLTLAFASSATVGTDGMIGFSNGTRTLPFTVPATQTQATFPTAPNPAIVTGTVAGTITLTASLSAGGQDITPTPAPTKTIVIDKAVPVISSVTLQQASGGLTVVVKGYSNTREVSSGSFTFAVSSGNTLSQSQVTVPLTSAYATWFGNTASNATGGLFQLIVPFNVTGNATAITKVTVTLTNSIGASAAVSSP